MPVTGAVINAVVNAVIPIFVRIIERGSAWVGFTISIVGEDAGAADLVPDRVYPVLHVGVQEDQCARVEVQAEPGSPLGMAPDASHELPLHTAVSVRMPALHDLLPERV